MHEKKENSLGSRKCVSVAVVSTIAFGRGRPVRAARFPKHGAAKKSWLQIEHFCSIAGALSPSLALHSQEAFLYVRIRLFMLRITISRRTCIDFRNIAL